MARVEHDDLTAKQNDYAIFLPALSSFYGTFIGKQKKWLTTMLTLPGCLQNYLTWKTLIG